MKKYILGVLLCMAANLAFAQGELQFTILKSNQKGLSEEVVENLDLRLKQIFARNSAAAASPYNVFAIEPVFEFSEELEVDGLIEGMSVVKGELTLIAKNLVDGTIYYNMVFPVKGSGVGGKEKAMKSMLTGIKSTDPKFTRFIRTTRQKITDYYAVNCSAILERAELLCTQGRYEEAEIYLSGVTDALPCYQQAVELLKEIAKKKPAEPDTTVVTKVVRDTVYIREPAEPEQKPVVEPAKPKYKLKNSANDLDVKVLRCFGNEEKGRITLEIQVVNRNRDISDGDLDFHTAITGEGRECRRLGSNGDSHVFFHQKMPVDIPMKLAFYVLDLHEKTDKLVFLELEVRGANIEIRDLPVEWPVSDNN